MRALPATPRCAEALELAVHALIGISPFNSYFSEARIRALVQWGQQRFSSFQLFIPDEPARYTLEALGYEPVRARRKARRQANYLKNKIARALRAQGIADEQHSAIVVDWQVLQSNPRYQQVHQSCRQLFESNADFRATCMDASAWVLQDRTDPHGQPEISALERAAEYFLAELPLFVATPSILEQPASVFCYHRLPEFLQRLYQPDQPLPVDPGQGFAVLREAATQAA